MIEATQSSGLFCNVCANEWGEETSDVAMSIALARTDHERRTTNHGPRYESIDDLIKKCHVRRDEIATLAEIGALNSLGYDRRSALWQIERAVRPSGELFVGQDDENQISQKGVAARDAATREGERTTDHAPRTTDH